MGKTFEIKVGGGVVDIVKVLRPEPGDFLAVKTTKPLKAEQQKEAEQALRGVLKANGIDLPVLVLPDDNLVAEIQSVEALENLRDYLTGRIEKLKEETRGQAHPQN